MMRTAVEIVEVCPRDGLQDEHDVVPTAGKLALVEATMAAGLRRIEVASFVHAGRVPQMADAEAVVAGLPRTPDVSYIGLVLNAKGMDRAEQTALDEINTVVPVTDTFSRANQGMSAFDAMTTAEAVVGRAGPAGLRATVTLAVAFGCPYEGLVAPEHVLALAQRAAEAGATEVALADTIGCAVPTQTEDLTAAVRVATGLPVRVHLHDSRGTGLANAVAALRAGASALDASVAGLGGCPSAPGASGNIATEDLVDMLTRMGVDTGVDAGAVLRAAALVEDLVGHRGSGRLGVVGPFPPLLAAGTSGSPPAAG